MRVWLSVAPATRAEATLAARRLLAPFSIGGCAGRLGSEVTIREAGLFPEVALEVPGRFDLTAEAIEKLAGVPGLAMDQVIRRRRMPARPQTSIGIQ